MRRPVALGVAWLLWIWGVATASAYFLSDASGARGWPPCVTQRVTPLTRWDSGWYLSIAESGYELPPSARHQNTNHAFFPLYPLLMRLVVRTVGLETSHAGNVISGVSLLVALVLFAGWVRKRWGEEGVWPALLALVAFPTSFFFGAVYSEGLFLVLALASVWAVDAKRPAASVVAGFLAGLTRISGLALAPYLFLCQLRREREAGRAGPGVWGRAAAVGAAPLAGLALFFLYLQWRFGDPFLFVRAQQSWMSAPVGVLGGAGVACSNALRDIAGGRLFLDWPARTLEGLFLVLFLGIAVALLVARRLPEAAYVGATVGLALLNGTFESAGRYVLVAFPAFAALGGICRRSSTRRLLLVGSLIAQAAYIWTFVHWYWAG